MADLLVPFSCFVGWLPAGLPTSDGGVLPHTVNPRNPWWSAGSVDLSAPPLDEDGEPTRLDALPWAIGVLGRGGVLLLLTDWPTLDGLDEDAALRAIVAAALRARVGLAEVSP